MASTWDVVMLAKYDTAASLCTEEAATAVELSSRRLQAPGCARRPQPRLPSRCLRQQSFTPSMSSVVRLPSSFCKFVPTRERSSNELVTPSTSPTSSKSFISISIEKNSVPRLIVFFAFEIMPFIHVVACGGEVDPVALGRTAGLEYTLQGMRDTTTLCVTIKIFLTHFLTHYMATWSK